MHDFNNAAKQTVDAELVRREQAKEAMARTVPVTVTTVPAVQRVLSVAVTGRSAVASYLDAVAPASIVGRLLKFDKNGRFSCTDDGSVYEDDVDYVARSSTRR